MTTTPQTMLELADTVDIHGFVQVYNFCFDGGGIYTPTDRDKAMLEDAINCYVAECEQAATALRAQSPTVSGGGMREALEAAKEFADDEFSDAVDLNRKNRISRLCDKIDAALSTVPQGQEYPMPAGEALREDIKARLRNHWITNIICDHETKTDRAVCSCTVWRCEPQPSIGAAVEAWIEHIFSHCERCNGSGETSHAEGGPQYECSDCSGTGVSALALPSVAAPSRKED